MTPRPEGQSCANCRYFEDYSDTEPLDELNGYCSQLVITLGLEAAVKINEYGGHWTHTSHWCDKWALAPAKEDQ